MSEKITSTPEEIIDSTESEKPDWQWKQFAFGAKRLILTSDFASLEKEDKARIFDAVRNYKGIDEAEKYHLGVGAGSYGDVYELCKNPDTVVKELRSNETPSWHSFEAVTSRYFNLKKVIQKQNVDWLKIPRHYGLLAKSRFFDPEPIKDGKNGHKHAYLLMEKAPGKTLNDISNYLLAERGRGRVNQDMEKFLHLIGIDPDADHSSMYELVNDMHEEIEDRYLDFRNASGENKYDFPDDIDNRKNIILTEKSATNMTLPYDVWIVDL